MKKNSELEHLRRIVISDGIAHIYYRATELNDIIHPYSMTNYELMSDDFISFMERYKTIIPNNVPIVLEIEGEHFDEQQKKTIDNAIWTHFLLNLKAATLEWKKCTRLMLWHFIFIFLSSIPLFVVERVSDEVIINFAYIPFWFFAYRFLIHLTLDYYPMWKNFRWYKRLASLKLYFAGEKPDDMHTLKSEISEYEQETMQALQENSIVENYLMDKDSFVLGCCVESIDDIMSPNYSEDWGFLSDEMGAFLSQSAPLIKTDHKIKLEIIGGSFSEKQQSCIREGIAHYYNYLIAEEEREREDNAKKIRFFSIFMIISAVILAIWGKHVDVAMHEFIIILLWFFGDYLMEFLLLNPKTYNENKKKWKALAEMEVSFKSETKK